MSRSRIDWRAALALHRDGWTYSGIARKYGCHYATVSKHLRALGARTHSSPAWDTAKGRRLYGVWSRTRSRCNSPKDPSFQFYGGRGIRVSPAWDRFRPFYEWAIRTGYRPAQRLVLVDQDRDFAPGNCRWTARRERRSPTSAPRVPAFGEAKTVGEWARDPRCAVSRPTLRERLLDGVPPEVAMRTPARSKWDPSLPKAKKPAIPKRTYAATDWDLALRLRVEQGMSPKDIAAPSASPTRRSRSASCSGWDRRSRRALGTATTGGGSTRPGGRCGRGPQTRATASTRPTARSACASAGSGATSRRSAAGRSGPRGGPASAWPGFGSAGPTRRRTASGSRGRR